MGVLYLSLSKYENSAAPAARGGKAAAPQAVREFHICREVRDEYALEHTLFSLRGNVILADFRQVRELTRRFNARIDPAAQPERVIKAGQLNAMGLIDEILHYMAALYRQQVRPDAFDTAMTRLENTLGPDKSAALLRAFSEQFPPQAVYAGETTADGYLDGTEAGESCRSLSVEELLLLALANLNPAFNPFKFLFDDEDLAEKTVYIQAIAEIRAHFAELPPFGPDGLSLWDLLRSPALASPDSLAGQLEFMRKKWGLLLGKYMARLLTSLDVIKEEEKPSFFGPGPTEVYTYGALDSEYERFSPDQEWMPRTVLMAKSTLVWLFQLSQRYGQPIERLDQIPDEELDELARRGFTGLWLIGLWERSNASKTVKQWTGNPEAAASAYSLYDYDIAGELGGWESLANLRERCARRGIRLGSDMVPNHTGIDSRWVMEHPDRFLQLRHPPFPTYTFNGGNLSSRDGVGVYIEDHYYNRSDAAVVFKRVDFNTGDVRYIYHGNDGTSMPWNDTAQIDFLNPEAREAVIRTIVGVCKQFSIVRFDAAMTLAKRHIQRLWYPEPGHGGDIASRAEHAISAAEFNRRIPNEFWREVVDRCAEEAPHTLLLAEAFWMMEGYFVRTLGMHRVYNSAFMNMLKNEENAKYRATVKNTLEFDPEILKRFVNFMNNPDEETAVAQFGRGDKYFGICTLLVTMPGLPMFGHGQIEGFEEKYGMEYRRAYRNEAPDPDLVARHERDIFPLMKKRAVFSGSAAFRLYDFFISGGGVNENVFAYSNRDWDDRSLVLYNNSYYAASGWIRQSSPAIPQQDGSFRQDTLSEALSIHGDERYFTLLREQRSGLWYIRSSKDICERGLFVSLNGYEAQVFLDIQEVTDLNGRWARLNHELSGRGVPDLQAAIQDLFLGALYRSFISLVQANPPDRESLKKPVLDFVAIAREYINGAGGRYDPFLTGWDHPPVDPEKIWDEFAAFFDRWTLMAGGADMVPVKLEKDAARFLERIRERVRAKPAIAGFAGAYGVLALLRSIIGEGAAGADAAALGDHWQLYRKLGDCLAAPELPGGEAHRVIELMRLVLSRTSPEDISPYQVPPLGASLILANYHTEDFRKLLGVNLFEDTVWFNKEAFEEALFYGSLFLALEGEAALEGVRRPGSGPAGGKTAPAPAGKAQKTAPTAPGTTDPRWHIRLERIARLTDRIERAEKASGYKLERLIELLSEGGGEPGPGGGKKAASKKTVKKP
jgi:glycosidase